jgi:hypothetical protein
MSDEIKEDRGDSIPASDESGDTDDQNLEAEKKDQSGDADDNEDKKDGEKEGSDESADAADKEDKDEGEDGDGEKEKDVRIPKARFDQAVAKARREAEAAQKHAEELQAQLDAQQGALDVEAVEEQIDKLEDELEGAITDGNTEKKLRLRKEIRRLNQDIAESKAAQHAARATAIAIERVTYDGLVKQMEVEHPELNPDDEGYDQDSVNEVNELKEAFEAKGHGSTEALRKALRATYNRAPAKPKVTEESGDEGNSKAADAAAKRKAEAVKRGLDTKKSQPSDGSKAGLDSDKGGKKSKITDVTSLSDKQFEELPEEELKRARGDTM